VWFEGRRIRSPGGKYAKRGAGDGPPRINGGRAAHCCGGMLARPHQPQVPRGAPARRPERSTLRSGRLAGLARCLCAPREQRVPVHVEGPVTPTLVVAFRQRAARARFVSCVRA